MIFLKRTATVLLALFFLPGCQGELQQPNFQYVLQNPAEVGSKYSNLYKDDSGNIYMSWLLNIEEEISALQYSVYNGETWTEPSTVHVGTDFFSNWADFPSVVGRNGSPVAAHWLKKIEGGPYAYNVNIAFPGERRWGAPITAHLDGTPTEHGFVSLEPLDDYKVLAIWLDGRKTDGRDHHDYSDIDQAMTLRSAEISSSGEITRKRVIDEAVCDCCQTDLVATEGGYLAVYRNRTEDEIRDIYIARYDLETGEWGEPSAVHDDNWQIMACPVNGPRVVARGNRVAVAWYTMADNKPKVLLARSADGGVSFDEPIVIADDTAIGRTDLIITEEGSIYVSWMNRRGEFGDILVREVKPDGELGEPVHAGVTSSSRRSGFPMIEKSGETILVAWTQADPLIRVRTARIPIDRENL